MVFYTPDPYGLRTLIGRVIYYFHHLRHNPLVYSTRGLGEAAPEAENLGRFVPSLSTYIFLGR